MSADQQLENEIVNQKSNPTDRQEHINWLIKLGIRTQTIEASRLGATDSASPSQTFIDQTKQQLVFPLVTYDDNAAQSSSNDGVIERDQVIQIERAHPRWYQTDDSIKPITVDPLLICSVDVRLSTSRKYHEDLTGLQVWAIALYACQFLTTNPQFVRDRRVLELGSGVGMVGLHAARVASHVTLSDCNDNSLLLCEESVKINGMQSRCSVVELEWGSDELPAGAPFDVIIGSELLYKLSTLDILMETVDSCLADTVTNANGTVEPAVFVLAWQPRYDSVTSHVFTVLKHYHFQAWLAVQDMHTFNESDAQLQERVMYGVKARRIESVEQLPKESQPFIVLIVRE